MGYLAESDKIFFNDNGFLVVRVALERETIDASLDRLWEILEEDRNDTAGPSCGHNVRIALITRCLRKDLDQIKFETPDDMWRYWDGIS